MIRSIFQPQTDSRSFGGYVFRRYQFTEGNVWCCAEPLVLATPEASPPTKEGLCKVIESEVMINGMAQPKERLVSIYVGKKNPFTTGRGNRHS
jgi:hypothetical protein